MSLFLSVFAATQALLTIGALMRPLTADQLDAPPEQDGQIQRTTPIIDAPEARLDALLYEAGPELVLRDHEPSPIPA